MPWRASTPMSLRQEFVQFVAHQTVPVSELCRRYGISRKTGHKWLRRFQTAGPHGLVDRSRRPHRSVAVTSSADGKRLNGIRRFRRPPSPPSPPCIDWGDR